MKNANLTIYVCSYINVYILCWINYESLGIFCIISIDNNCDIDALKENGGDKIQTKRPTITP
jgi:hypothetical protein